MNLYEIRQKLGSGGNIYDLPLRVTYYARVSTGKDEQLHSLSGQVGYYEKMIRSNENWTFVKGYVDEGISGTSTSRRTSFNRMIEDGKRGEFDFIITKEISRFARDTLDSIQYTRELLSAGVGVLFQNDNINTLLPDAELRLTIMASIAQDEVRKLSERVRFGFKRSIENGVVLGNNNIWGYKKDNGKLVVVEEEAEIVRKIFDLYGNHLFGCRRICTWLFDNGYKTRDGKEFSYGTVRNIITNPKYKGYYCGNKTHKVDYRSSAKIQVEPKQWKCYKDEMNVPAIVSEELWEKANALMKSRGGDNLSKGHNNQYLYSGKIICMEHNLKYHRSLYKKKNDDGSIKFEKELWRCSEYEKKGLRGCDMPLIYTWELNEVVRQILLSLKLNKEMISKELMEVYREALSDDTSQSVINEYETQIENVLLLKDKLLELSLRGIISEAEFESRNNRFNEEIEELTKKRNRLIEEKTKTDRIKSDLEPIMSSAFNALDFRDEPDAFFIMSFLDRIEVYKTSDRNFVRLKIYVKFLAAPEEYIIKRTRTTASVCKLSST